MKLCRHRHRDDRHCIAAPSYRAKGPAIDGRLPSPSLKMSHGAGVLNIAKIVCPRPRFIGDCRKSRIGNLRLSAISLFSRI